MATFEAPKEAAPEAAEVVRQLIAAEVTNDTPVQATKLPTGEVVLPLATVGDDQRMIVGTPTKVHPIATHEMISQMDQQVIQQLQTIADEGRLPVNTVVSVTTNSGLSNNEYVWRIWNKRHGTASTSGWRTTEDEAIWTNWVNSSSSATTGNYVWRAWIDEYEKACDHKYRRLNSGRSQEEQAAYELRQKEAREREEAARKVRVAAIATAQDKAQKLLLSALDDKQKDELKSKGYFHCKSRKGVVYRIYKGTHGNVKRLDERGREIEKLCVQPDNVPDFDAMLAQKLHIEFNEDDFRKTANITRMMN